MPEASSAQALARMQRQKQRDTQPEIRLRQILHGRGYRFRVNRPALPGSRRRHDLIFPREKVAVEVRGCFWHSCPEHATQPKANRAWWSEKLEANVARDADSSRRLVAAGWDLVVVWEHDDPEAAVERIIRALDAGRPRPAGEKPVTPSP